MKLNKALKAFSAYARPEEHLIKQTFSGAVVTLVGCTLALILFISELYQYMHPVPVHEMSVETERHALLKLTMDITFPSLPCSLLSVDMIDSSGDAESDGTSAHHIEHMHLHKVRLDSNGRRISRGEYQAPAPDMITVVGGMLIQESRQHITDMQQEVEDKEGCRVYGYMDVKRLAGNLQITVHLKDWIIVASMLHDARAAKASARLRENPRHELPELIEFDRANVSHHITKLSFGPTFPGQVNPLDGFHRIVDHDYGTYSYFLKVVPTTFVSSWWSKVHTCQYSVSEYFSPGSSAHKSGEMNVERIPAVSFSYDMSPLNVKIWYPGHSVGHFLVRLCAVLGGCFALTGWLDGLVHFVLRLIG